MNPRTALSDQESRMSWLTMHITNHIYYLTGSSTYNSLSLVLASGRRVDSRVDLAGAPSGGILVRVRVRLGLA